MSRNAWIPSIIIAAVCLLCTALAQQPAPPEKPLAPGKIPNAVEEPALAIAANALPGRYQAVALGQGGMYLVVDTHTGQCWSKYEHQLKWRDQGSPVTAKE